MVHALSDGASASTMSHAFAMGTDESKAVDEVRTRLDLSTSRFGGQNEVFRQLNRYYLSLSPTIESRDNDRNVAEHSRYPNLFVPRSFTAVEAATPPWVFAVLGGTPPVRVFARKGEYEENAQAVEKMLTYDWQRSSVLYRSIHVAKQMFKYGTGIAKVGYKHDQYEIEREYEMTLPRGMNALGKILMGSTRLKRKEQVTRFDGPWLEPWSVYNFHPDPYYSDIREMRYVCARRWTDRETLKYEDEQHRKHTGKSLYQHLDRIPRIKKGFVENLYSVDHGDDLAEAMGWSGSYHLGGNNYAGGFGNRDDKRDDLVEIVEYWSRDDRVVFLANGEVPIMDSENPFDDKEIPFVAARCHVLDNQFWGYGILHPIMRTQEEINEHRNLILRQAQLNINNVWAYDEDAGIPPNLTYISPGAMYPVHFSQNGNPKMVPLLQGRPLPSEAYAMEDRMDMDMQTAIAMPQYRSGSPAGGGDTTATEAQIAAANVEARTRLMALGGELTYATEIARLFHSRRQQFLEDDGTVFRVLGEAGTEYVRMDPERIAGEFDFEVAGTNLYATKDVLRQQLLQALSVIKGDPVLMELTDMPRLMEEMWTMFDFQNPKRFMRPPNVRTEDPNKENIILLAGEPEKVEATDSHEEHMEAHQRALVEAISNGNQMAQQRITEHMQEHQRYLKQQQATAPPQEQPGLRGYEGNVPNMENAAETQGGLNARVGGGTMGGG